MKTSFTDALVIRHTLKALPQFKLQTASIVLIYNSILTLGTPNELINCLLVHAFLTVDKPIAYKCFRVQPSASRDFPFQQPFCVAALQCCLCRKQSRDCELPKFVVRTSISLSRTSWTTLSVIVSSALVA